MKPSTLECLHVLEGVKALADIAIEENSIKDTGLKFLSYANRPFIGASTFLCRLMRCCKENQTKDVSWLINECMPELHPFFMEVILNSQIAMYMRFRDARNVSFCVETVQARWKKKGIIGKDFTPSGLFEKK